MFSWTFWEKVSFRSLWQPFFLHCTTVWARNKWRRRSAWVKNKFFPQKLQDNGLVKCIVTEHNSSALISCTHTHTPSLGHQICKDMHPDMNRNKKCEVNKRTQHTPLYFYLTSSAVWHLPAMLSRMTFYERKPRNMHTHPYTRTQELTWMLSSLSGGIADPVCRTPLAMIIWKNCKHHEWWEILHDKSIFCWQQLPHPNFQHDNQPPTPTTLINTDKLQHWTVLLTGAGQAWWLVSCLCLHRPNHTQCQYHPEHLCHHCHPWLHLQLYPSCGWQNCVAHSMPQW